MIQICNNVLRLSSGATLIDLIEQIENNKDLPKARLDICLPNGYALSDLDLDSINKTKCTGCLLCQEDARHIDQHGVPTADEKEIPLNKVCEGAFNGKYFEFGPAPEKLARHSSKDERTITNPMIALFLWRLSSDLENTYICPSPSWELSIDTADSLDEREGHLDIVVSHSKRKILLVGEGKSTVNSLLRDITSEQWKRYYHSILEICNAYDYDCIFTYSIGGSEYEMYPPTSEVPHYSRREEFYTFIKKDKKHFLSVEALRTLLAWKLSVDNQWCWEDHFQQIFKPTFPTVNHRFLMKFN